MKLVNFCLMIPTSTLGAVGKHRTQTIHRLALPCAHLVRMNLVLGRNLLDRPVNARGPDGLIDGKAPGNPSKLNDDQRQALSGIV